MSKKKKRTSTSKKKTSPKKGYHFGKLKQVSLAKLQAAYAKVVIGPTRVRPTATQT